MTVGQPLFRDEAVLQFYTGVAQALREGLFAEAIDSLERMLETAMDYPGASTALKCAAFWKERFEREHAARDAFERGEQLMALWRLFQAFSERLPDMPERCLFAIKQFVFSSALACYLSTGSESGPAGGDPDVLLQIGRCCKGLGNYERAIENLERANIERKEDPRILAELADCYSLVNEARAAKVFLRESFFLDPQAIDLAGLESPLVLRLAARLRGMGYSGPALAEWMPVYGVIWGVFNVKREMKPLEFGKLKQGIYQLEKDCGAAGAARDLLVPRLINRYFWLIEHYLTTGEPRDRIEEILAKIRELDPRVHQEYTA